MFTLIRVRDQSGFWFMACTSFTSTSERSWSLVQGQLNTSTDNLQLNQIERMLCKKVTIFHYIVNNFTNRAHLPLNN